MISLGLDISLTGTGVVILEVLKGKKDQTVLWQGEVVSDAKDRYERVDEIATRVHSLLTIYRPDVVTLEGYGQGRHGNVQAFVKVVEVTTMIRMMLYSEGHRWLEVPPQSLKKFVTGKGKISHKREMINGVRELWGFGTRSHNVADAYGLAAFGLARRGAIPVRPWQVDAMDSVKDRS